MKAMACAALGALLFSAPAQAIVEPYIAAWHGMKCDLEPSDALTCHYGIGASLEFILRRIGEPGVQLEILRNDRTGDYALDPKFLGTCLVIRHGWSARAGRQARSATTR